MRKMKRVLMSVDFVVEVPEEAELSELTLELALESVTPVCPLTGQRGHVIGFSTTWVSEAADPASEHVE